MTEYPNYALSPGSMLDNRYKIEGLLGEGGCGITYIGTNLHVGIHVAIKEFFPRLFVRRSENGKDVVPVRSTDEPDLAARREAFLKEARLLGDFSAVPAVVRVTDSFAANSTSYMIMEYLDGKTLLRCVKEEGAFQAEDLFRMLLPVMDALEKIHASGLIHRDISPENLMVMPDRSVKLMDFGSAVPWTRTQDRELFLKEGYAPVEQYSSDGSLGPWTDLYALCATIYFGITSRVPLSSVSRLFFDELQKPSAIGIPIRKDLETVLWKGLQTDPGDRWRNVESFRSSVSVLLPEPVVKNRKRWKTFLAGVCCTAAAAVLVSGTVWYRIHRVSLKLSRTETVSVRLTASDKALAADYTSALKQIHDRVEAYAGKDNYLWKKEQDTVRVTIPSDCFGAGEPEDVFSQYLANAPALSLLNMDMKSSVLNEPRLLSLSMLSECRNDVRQEWIQDVSVEYEDENEDESENISRESSEKNGPVLRVVLTDHGADALAFLTATKKTIPFMLSQEPFFTVDAEMIGKRDSFQVQLPDKNTAAAVVSLLTAPGFDMSPEVDCEFLTDWDQAETYYSGKNQVMPSQIKGDTVCLEYRTDKTDTENLAKDLDQQSNDKPGWVMSILVLKQRLDSLNCPYAFGFSHFDNRVIRILFPAGSITDLEAELLFSNAEIDLLSSHGTFRETLFESNEVQVANDGTELHLSFTRYSRDKVLADLSLARQNGETDVSLYLGSTYLGMISSLGSGENEEELTCSFLCPFTSEMEEQTASSFADYIETIMKKDLDDDFSCYTLSAAECRSEKGEKEWSRSAPAVALVPMTAEGDSWENTLREKIEKDGGTVTIYKGAPPSVWIEYNSIPKDSLCPEALRTAQMVFQDPDTGVSSGRMNTLHISYSEDPKDNCVKGNYSFQMDLVNDIYSDHRIEFISYLYYNETNWAGDTRSVHENEGNSLFEDCVRRLHESQFYQTHFFPE